MIGVDGEPRLVDFGLAVQTTKKINTLAGTPYFMAPEVLAENYDSKCDVWSLGCILFMFVTGRMPFNGTTKPQVFDKIKN